MKHIVDQVGYHEWEFDTQEELIAAMTKEARVCGDEIRDNCIWNYHQQIYRWKGFVK